MTILITGASGNVGRPLVRELMKTEESIKVAGTKTDKLNKLFDKDIESVKFDFTDPSTFDPALKNVDRVFLMRPPHLGKAKDFYPFIDAMKKHNIKLVVFLSLMGVEKNPIPPHHRIEKYIEKVGLAYAHIRPGFFMQNLTGIHLREIREKGELFIPAGNSKTSFIDAKDIGVAAATLLRNPKKYQNTTHTITGPEALSYYDVADILSKVLGKPIRYTKPGLIEYRRYMIKERGLDKGYVNVTVALYLMTRMGTAKKVTNGFYQLTGKEPISFETFVNNNIHVFINEMLKTTNNHHNK